MSPALQDLVARGRGERVERELAVRIPHVHSVQREYVQVDVIV